MEKAGADWGIDFWDTLSDPFGQYFKRLSLPVGMDWWSGRRQTPDRQVTTKNYIEGRSQDRILLRVDCRRDRLGDLNAPDALADGSVIRQYDPYYEGFAGSAIVLRAITRRPHSQGHVLFHCKFR